MAHPPTDDQASTGRAARFFHGLGVFVAVLVLALAALELAGLVFPGLSARALDPERSHLESARVEPHPYLAYALKPGFSSDERAGGGRQVSHNSLGFRGPETTWDKPAGVYRIVCLGGSSTYGFGETSDATTWPVRLQEHLNAAGPPRRVEVINGGCQGYTSFESLINLSIRMVDLEPDLVVAYHAINDMRCAIWQEPRRDNSHWRAIWPVERPSAIERLLARTTTMRLLRNLDPAWRARRSGDLGWYAIRDYGRGTYSLRPSAAIGFQSLRRNLIDIVGVARQHGAQVVFGLQATRWSDFDRFGDEAWIQREGMKRALDITRATGAELDVPVVDLAAVLEAEAERQVAATGGDTIFTSEVHITDEGADLLARTLADRIVELGLLR